MHQTNSGGSKKSGREKIRASHFHPSDLPLREPSAVALRTARIGHHNGCTRGGLYLYPPLGHVSWVGAVFNPLWVALGSKPRALPCRVRSVGERGGSLLPVVVAYFSQRWGAY